MKNTKTTKNKTTEVAKEEAALPATTNAEPKEKQGTAYEATIITPHPYGVYGLCKLIEHLQTN